jgi:hypothetical protein
MTKRKVHEVLTALRSIPLQDAPKETWITTRLAALLPEGESEVCYAGTSQKCDARFRNDTGGHTWVELKYAQPYFSQSQALRDNRALFGKVLYETSIHDILSKLPSIAPISDNDRIGFALVLYYHQAGLLTLPQGCVDRFRGAARLKIDGWTEHHLQPWRNPNIAEPTCMIEVYYWERTLGANRPARLKKPKQDVPASIVDYPAFEKRAGKLLKNYLRLPDWVWEDWVAEVLSLDRSSAAVSKIGDRIRQSEGRYSASNYQSPARVERVIATLYNEVKRVTTR